MTPPPNSRTRNTRRPAMVENPAAWPDALIANARLSFPPESVPRLFIAPAA